MLDFLAVEEPPKRGGGFTKLAVTQLKYNLNTFYSSNEIGIQTDWSLKPADPYLFVATNHSEEAFAGWHS